MWGILFHFCQLWAVKAKSIVWQYRGKTRVLGYREMSFLLGIEQVKCHKDAKHTKCDKSVDWPRKLFWHFYAWADSNLRKFWKHHEWFSLQFCFKFMLSKFVCKNMSNEVHVRVFLITLLYQYGTWMSLFHIKYARLVIVLMANISYQCYR